MKGGRYIKISIEDRGGGIHPEHLPKIFDPFFTTKRDGSGLGLATAYSVVKGHAGHIHVDSDVGVGTTFHIYLPASNKSLGLERPKPGKPMKGKGKILLIDDERIIRRSAGDILKRLGYEVEFAENGTEGIELYKKAMKAGESFDAVIMDLTIPGGMGGREAIQILMKIDPHAKVIVSSGYSNDPVMANFRQYGFSGVLTKPYIMEELADILHNMVAEFD